jgi:hypothetical protein
VEAIPKVLAVTVPPHKHWFECDTALPRLQILALPRVKPKWELAHSAWARRPAESDSQAWWDMSTVKNRAFKMDWGHAKLPRVIKDHDAREEIHHLMADHYDDILIILREYGAMSTRDPFSVSWNSFRDIVKDANLAVAGNPACDNAALDTQFIATNLELTAEARAHDNSDNDLVRFEVMEIIVRCAKCRYAHDVMLVTLPDVTLATL